VWRGLDRKDRTEGIWGKSGMIPGEAWPRPPVSTGNEREPRTGSSEPIPFTSPDQLANNVLSTTGMVSVTYA
jgi:hypothetical protein